MPLRPKKIMRRKTGGIVRPCLQCVKKNVRD
jgi:hypothetical protein